jgi:hypothetical protein
MPYLILLVHDVRRIGRLFRAHDVGHQHEHNRQRWKTNLAVLVTLWLVLLIASLTILSSVVSPFLKTLQSSSVVSLDWAGYVVSSGLLAQQPLVTAVNGSWVVPRVEVSVDDAFSAAWIGIGGQSEETLIQCGTEHDSRGGQAFYSVWYEMLPDNSITVDQMTVSPGDVITASISLVESSTNDWLLQIEDTTTGQRFSQVFAYNSSRLTAEWVVERPTVNNKLSNLADFSSVTFTGVHAQIGGASGTIKDFANYQVVMSDVQNNVLASVSHGSLDGSSFDVIFQQSV